MEVGPWNIEGYPLILKMWNQNMAVEDIDFSSLPLWIQVHDLPIEYMSKENAEEIGAMVGEVLEVDFTGNGGVCMSKFLIVKVEHKVEDPLRSGFFLDRSPQPDLWIQFKYERIADFCYQCGRLGHLKARCSTSNPSFEQQSRQEPYRFGPWMKAESTSKRTTRWVEFMVELAQSAKESDDGQLNSMDVVGGRRVIHAPSEVVSTEQSGTLNDTIEISRNHLINFKDLSAHVNSKQLSLGNFFKPPTSNQPET